MGRCGAQGTGSCETREGVRGSEPTLELAFRTDLEPGRVGGGAGRVG